MRNGTNKHEEERGPVYEQITSRFCTMPINLSPITYNTKMVKLLPLLNTSAIRWAMST
jgi:hypothetical protein